MYRDKRKGLRRLLRYTGWISLGSGDRHGCVIADISDSGARLRVENADQIPDEFQLLLSARANPKRHCYVVWRTADQIGCQFDRPLTASEKTRPIRKAEEMSREDAATPATAKEPA